MKYLTFLRSIVATILCFLLIVSACMIQSFAFPAVEEEYIDCSEKIAIVHENGLHLLEIIKHANQIKDIDTTEYVEMYLTCIQEECALRAMEEYTVREAEMIAVTILAEANGSSLLEQSAVAWCILNRVDYQYNGKTTIEGVLRDPGQFSYGYLKPFTQETLDLAKDVMSRWLMEQYGIEDVGRTLPENYMWFHGDGRHNYFKTANASNIFWDWSLPNPYEEGIPA